MPIQELLDLGCRPKITEKAPRAVVRGALSDQLPAIASGFLISGRTGHQRPLPARKMPAKWRRQSSLPPP